MAFEELARRLAVLDPTPPTATADQRRAAVAIALRLDLGTPEVLLMRRAERADDHWSGQISLPGGHHEPGDGSLLATAVREAQEEVGVDLERDARVLGELAPLQARARGRMLPLYLWPFVFGSTSIGDLRPGVEAEEAFWFPLDRAAGGELDGSYRYTRDDGTAVALPSWRFEGRTVWGLTHMILSGFLEIAGDALGPG